LIVRSLKKLLLSLTILALPTAALAASGDATHGEEVYQKRCSQCHGVSGAADGPAATRGFPRPRPFANNTMFKIRTTPVGALPTDDDLFNIISRGLGGTTMPPFDVLPEQDRWDVVAYIKSLTEEFADPEYLAEAQPIAEVASASAPPATPESLEKGRALFEENCVKCHGAHGRGNGEQRTASSMKDKWFSLRMLPANLSNPESYRGGATAEDIFRSITTGLDGTPMPSHLEMLNTEERWATTHHVMSFHPPHKKTRDAKVTAAQAETLPEDGLSEAWDTIEASRFQMVPNIVEPPRNFWPAVEYVNVQAAYTESEIAFRIQWDDRDHSTGSNVDTVYEDADTEIYWETDHPDQIAVQFAAKRDDVARPYFLMGDRKKAVNTWWWRADTDSLQEINAKGYGNFTIQGEEDQNLNGQVTYEDGRYTLYVRRSMRTDGKGDVQFEAGRFEPIAFNIWDGSRGEVGNRRSLTSWFWVYLQPDIPQSAYVRPPIFFLFTLLILGLVVRKNKVRAEAGDFDNLAPLPDAEVEGLLTRLFKRDVPDVEDTETEEAHDDHHDDHHHALHWSQWPKDADMGSASQGKIGMWLFLLSDCFSFSGLLLGYGVLRSGSEVWHCTPEVLAAGIQCGPIEPEFGLGFTAVLTFILICSSVSMVLAIGACMENKRKEMLVWLGTTVIFGAFFLLGQFKEYWGLPALGHLVEPINHSFGEWLHHGLTDEGVNWGASHRSTTFYLITGFHGMHVTTGVCLLTWTWTKAYRGHFDNGDYNFMEIIGLFWHFVDLVWILVFTLVYLIPANPGLH
jgi:DMSO reductase family type II enzyme heme b subunit